MGRIWWISYHGPDGKRCAESSESERKGDAERLLQRRVGAREHNLPVIQKAEQLTFDDAAQAVITSYEIKWNDLAAMAVMVTIPVLTLFFVIQRWLVGGLAAGYGKG